MGGFSQEVAEMAWPIIISAEVFRDKNFVPSGGEDFS
jgi:hypothetical protein